MIAGTESVERIRNAVDVIKEFADDCAPSGGAGLKCVRRAVIGIDERALASVGAAGKTGGICQIVRDARIDGLIDSGESIDPTVLREIVVIETDSSAKNGVLRCAGNVSETEAR